MQFPQTIGSKIVTLSLGLVFISLGLKESFNSMANMLFVISSLIWGDYKFLRKLMVKKNPIWLFTSLFLIYLVGSIYSADSDEALRRLAIKFMLFLWPWCMVLAWPVVQKTIVIRLLVLAPSFIALATLIRATARYFGQGDFTGNWEVFRYYRLSAYAMHPNYFMLFLGGALILLWWYRRQQKSIFNPSIDTLMWWGLLLYCGVFLQARTGFIILIALLTLATLFFEKKFVLKDYARRLYYPVVAGSLLLLLPSHFTQRYQINTSTEFVEEENRDTSFSGRLVIWKHCWHCIMEKPLVGHGTGDGVQRVHKRYEEAAFEAGIRDKYNCHNQYWETWVAVGIVGLLILIGFPLFVLKKYTDSNIALVVFSLFFYSGMFFESILERHKGVMILVIFATILILLTPNKKAHEL